MYLFVDLQLLNTVDILYPECLESGRFLMRGVKGREIDGSALRNACCPWGQLTLSHSQLFELQLQGLYCPLLASTGIYRLVAYTLIKTNQKMFWIGEFFNFGILVYT